MKKLYAILPLLITLVSDALLAGDHSDVLRIACRTFWGKREIEATFAKSRYRDKEIQTPISPSITLALPAPRAVDPVKESTAHPITNLDMLKQPNGWECGWYSVFHYLATKNEYPRESLDEEYINFVEALTEDDEEANTLYDDEDYLGETELRALIERAGGDNDEVIIIEEQQISGSIPLSRDIIDQVAVARERGETFWVLVCTLRPAHWVCLMFPSEGGCIGIDSLQGNRPPNRQPILVTIKNLCLGIISLPSGDQYHTTYHDYQRIADIPKATPAYQEALAAIRAEALTNGFTEETLGSLLRYIDSRHKPVVLPKEKRKKKSNPPQEAIEISDSEEEEEKKADAAKAKPQKSPQKMRRAKGRPTEAPDKPLRRSPRKR